MHRTDKEFWMDIIEACRRIELYTADLTYDEFLKNFEKQDAVIRNIDNILTQILEEIKNE